MKHHLLLSALACFLPAMLHAETTIAQDTIVQYKDKTILLLDRQNELEVIVRKKNGETCAPYYESRYSDDGKKKSTWHLNESFDFPLSSIILSEKKKSRKSDRSDHRIPFEGHWAGLGFGWCNAVGTSTGGLNGLGGVEPHMGASYEIFWNILSKSFRLGRSHMGIVTGIGIDWRNYRMDGNERFYKDGNQISLQPYPEGAKVEYSRLKTFDITLPLLLELQSDKRGKDFFLSFGPVLNLKTYASILTRYEIDGESKKDFHRGVRQSPVGMDLMGMCGWGCLGAYVKYSPFPTLQTKYCPEMQSLSCGLMLHF